MSLPGSKKKFEFVGKLCRRRKMSYKNEPDETFDTLLYKVPDYNMYVC